MEEVMIRNQHEDRTIVSSDVVLRETDLFEIWCHALESGEFVRAIGWMRKPDGSRCAWGVGYEMVERAFGAADVDAVVRLGS